MYSTIPDIPSRTKPQPFKYMPFERSRALTFVKTKKIKTEGSLFRPLKGYTLVECHRGEVPSGQLHLFGFAEESCIHCHPAAFATLETKVMDPILAASGWVKTLGTTPIAPGYPTLDLTDAVRS
jgi:hypothetical protein